MKYLRISFATRAPTTSDASVLGAMVQSGETRQYVLGDLSALGSMVDPAAELFRFGDGRDGDVTINSEITLTRDTFYNNLAMAAGGIINTANFRIYVADTLDLTACDAGAIRNRGGEPVDRTDNQTGTQTSTASPVANTLGAGQTGGTSAAGTNGTVPAAPAVLAAFDPGNGGRGGQGGIGGGDGTNAGGTFRASVAPVGLPILRLTNDILRGATLVGGGSGGTGGGGGRGAGTIGGAGGAGGSGAGTIFISARIIAVGGSTPVASVCAAGGKGAKGSTVTSGNRGGGGGGGGAGGGSVHVLLKTITGAAANVICADGGVGGNGGDGFGTGLGASGGDGGYGGRIVLIKLDAETLTHVDATATAGTAGAAGVGVTGGTGGAGAQARVSL